MVGSPATASVTFNRSCNVLRDNGGNNMRILSIPDQYTDYQRLELCTAIGIERIEIVNSMSITSLDFMRNINVSPLFGCNWRVSYYSFISVVGEGYCYS